MIISTLRIRPAPDRREEVLSALRHMVEPTGVEPGCICCRLFRDVGDDSVVVLMEEWESRSTLECHLRSEQYRSVLAAMECSVEPPEIRFSTISQTAGLEVIEAARAGTRQSRQPGGAISC